MRTLPIIVSPSNPVGLDLAIKKKQEALSLLTYKKNGVDVNLFNVVWGVAQRDEDDNKPIIKQKGLDYFSPETDNYKAICFFRESADRDYSGRVIYSCDLYVMLVLGYFTNNEAEKISIKEHVISKVVKCLRHNAQSDHRLDISVTTDTHEVFNPYSIDIKGYFKYPFDNFRVSFKDSYELGCGNEMTIN